MSGTADRMGERGSLLWLTALMVALVISLAWLSTRPRLFNLPVELTPGNAQSVYREGERMMVCLLVALVVIHLRSEEHTSELQSRGHLVCRLLLEKKKKNNNN